MTAPVDLDRLPPVATASPCTGAEIEAFASGGEPVLLPGLLAAWPIVTAGRTSPQALLAYLRERDDGRDAPIMEAPPAAGGRFGYAADPREFSFTRRTRPFLESLERIGRALAQPDGPCIAIQMLPLNERLPRLLAENPLPLAQADAQPKLWLGGPVRTQIHNDRDHNLACVVAGRRRFVLFPPTAVADLYIGPIDNPPPLSLVDPEAPDLARFPRFLDALSVARVAELAPGDALLMPRHWWHHVTSRDPLNAMINIWWGERERGLADPLEAFLAGLLAFKALPPAERDYWRAVFDLHVFGDGGGDHLPPSARGLLGAMTPALRARLRQRLKAAAAAS